MSEIDWSVFDAYSESTCACLCGAEFRSHTKFVLGSPRPYIASRKPCPSCGAHVVSRSRSDSEKMTIRGKS